jgi:hypothetical protein
MLRGDAPLTEGGAASLIAAQSTERRTLRVNGGWLADRSLLPHVERAAKVADAAEEAAADGAGGGPKPGMVAALEDAMGLLVSRGAAAHAVEVAMLARPIDAGCAQLRRLCACACPCVLVCCLPAWMRLHVRARVW